MPPYLVGASTSLPADWLNNPDPDLYTSWDEFTKQLFWDFQMGEAFVMATAWYSNGYPARFHVVAPWMVNVELGGDGLRHYSINEVRTSSDVLLHIRYQGTTEDARGHGPLEAGAGRMVAAEALSRYASQLAASGGIPHSVLKHPANLNATQAYELQAAWVHGPHVEHGAAGGAVGWDRVRNRVAWIRSGWRWSIWPSGTSPGSVSCWGCHRS